MPLYESLGQGIYVIDAEYTAKGVACFYCMVEDDEVAIIETGTAHSLPNLLQLLTELSIQPEQVKYVIPTHVHLDHAGGVGVMMKQFPSAQLVVHPSGAKHMIDPSQLVKSTIEVYGAQAFKDLYGEIPPVEANRVISAKHESIIKLKNRELLIVHTPGHAYHHLCVVDDTSKGIFTGDTFGLAYPDIMHQQKRVVIPTTTPTQFDQAALHASIDLLVSHTPEKMYMTHFSILPDPVQFSDQLKVWIDKYADLTLKVKPVNDSQVNDLKIQMGEMIARGFNLSSDVINNKLAIDIKLNAQGLAYWYQKQLSKSS